MNFALAFEPKEDDVLKRDPKKNSSKKILQKGMLYIILGVGLITSFFLLALFIPLLYYYKLPIEEVRTIMFVGISLDALFFAFSFKSLRRPLWRINVFNNAYLLFALAASSLLLLSALYFAPLSNLLHISKPTPFGLLMMALVGVFNLAAIEGAKYLFIRHGYKYNMEL